MSEHPTRSSPLPPHKLWEQADREHPDDDDARRVRYIELMAEAGHLRFDPPPQDQYTADDPPPWINRHRYGGPGDA